MCGLAGTFAYGDQAPPVCSDALLRVRDAMQSRGPDAEGLWVDATRRVGLAHRRLAIIDLSEAGAQPMVDVATDNRIVFNGEIYNYRALRAELQAAGAVFRTHTDTEVLLHLYAAHGENMLPKLRGMFAFAIWDAQRHGLFLARDPFGIKPLYLADDGHSLRFASQVKALLAGGGIDTRAEAAGHVGFFLWGHVPEPFTLYRGIQALPAGQSLWVDTRGHKQRRAYIHLAAELCTPQPGEQPIAADEAREQLHAALRDSVCHHLVADVPVGVFLSSGIDSSTLAALTAECLGAAASK